MKLFLILSIFISLYAQKPKLLLLNRYSDDINVTGWYMSEKLDGVRAYWDGKHLISRGGKVFYAPEFFTKDFPAFELDGELWTKRGDFDYISSVARGRVYPENWERFTYNVFEVPHAKGNLLKRLKKVKESKYLKVIKQIKVKDKKHLEQFLKSVEKEGGEGVVVRDATLPYYTGRTNNSLKVKSYMDDECKVIGYTDGKGKYKGITGSLICKMDNNKIIKIGSGLSKKQRQNPPKIGSVVTFKYYGFTSKGNPRFVVFMRVRK
jgi:DNA ligase-1